MTSTPGRPDTPVWPGPDEAPPVAGGRHHRTASIDLGLMVSVLHINGGLVIRPRQLAQAPLDAEPLTAREREVLNLVAEGYPNKAIGQRLTIAERTVKSHLTDIMTKLRASDRTHAVVTAVRLGWLAI